MDQIGLRVGGFEAVNEKRRPEKEVREAITRKRRDEKDARMAINGKRSHETEVREALTRERRDEMRSVVRDDRPIVNRKWFYE